MKLLSRFRLLNAIGWLLSIHDNISLCPYFHFVFYANLRMPGAKAIGIDLGTTYSCVSFVKDNGDVKIIHNSHGNRITPSVVSFQKQLTLVGEEAVAKGGEDPKNTVFQIKRFMGRKANDEFLNRIRWLFRMENGANDMANIRVSPEGKDETLCPEEISALILRHMKTIAENYLKCEVRDAVITVPANFNDAQKQATKDAGAIAGLNVLKNVNEPTAAAIAYGQDNNDGKERTILVYDFGGGTFDVSIVRMKGMEAIVLATNGETFLGGENFNTRLREEATARFIDMNIDLRDRDWELCRACEKAKVELSFQNVARIELNSTTGRMVGFDITRATFNELCEDLFQQTKSCVVDTLGEAKMSEGDLDDIVLVGGSSRIPRVQQILKDLFGGRQLRHDIHPDEAVAYGAAILANSLSDPNSKSVRLADVTPLSLGLKDSAGLLIPFIPKNTPYPCEVTQNWCNASDFQTGIANRIYEGQRPMAEDNRLLGEFTMKVPPRPKGENKIINTMKVDKNGILKLSSIVVETGETAQIVVESGSLTADIVEQMILLAKRRAKSDDIEKKRRETITHFEDAVGKAKRAARNEKDDNTKATLNRIANEEMKWLNDHKNASQSVLECRLREVNASLCAFGVSKITL